MNILKALFGGKTEDPEERKQDEEAKNFDILKFDGVKALHLGEANHAINCFTQALNNKDDLETRDYLSQAFLMANEPLKAYEQLQKLAEAQPDNPKIFMRMADVAYRMDDYGAMADACEKALLIDEASPTVHYLYARACIGQGDNVNAVAMLTKAILTTPDYLDAYLLRGETLLAMDSLEEAEEDANFLVEHVAGNEDALLLKARVEKAKGYNAAAQEFYDKVIEANPFHADAFKERAEVREALGDLQGAEEDRNVSFNT